MNAVLENIKTRRSVRTFSDKPVERKDLEAITEAGLYAPSAMNNQVWQITAVCSRELLDELSNAISVILDRPDYNRFYKAPVLIIVSVPVNYEHGIADTACAIENMMLAAHSLGIGSVWINQFKNICGEKQMRDILDKCNIPADHEIWGTIAVGYGEPKSTTRENKGKVVFTD